MLNELEENDLILVTRSFFYTDACSKSIFLNQGKVRKGCIMLVLENNFGSIYKDRYTICLLGNKKILINNSSLGLNASLQRSSEENDYFKILNS